MPGLLTTVFLTNLGHGTLLGGYVLNPLGKLLDRAAAHVAAQIRLGTDKFAKVEEFMSSEAVVLHSSTPVVVDHAGTVLLRADTVDPVVFVGKASAGPAKHGHLDVTHSLKHIVTIAVGVGNGRIFAYPYTTVDTCSKVFGKLAVYLLINHRSRFLRIQRHSYVLVSSVGD